MFGSNNTPRTSRVTQAREYVESNKQRTFLQDAYVSASTKQTTTMSHRDCDFQNWKRRDYQVGDKVRNGNETKSGDRSDDAQDQCCSTAAKTGLSGGTVRTGQRAADTAPSLPPRTTFGPQPVDSQAALLSSARLSSARLLDIDAGVQTAGYRSSSTSSSRCFVSPRSKESVPDCLSNEGEEDSSTVHDINGYGDVKKETEITINVSEHDTIDLNLDQQTRDATTARKCSEDFCGEEVSSSDGSKNSEDCLRVPDIYYHGGNSSAPNPNSIVTSQFRRLESRRGSSVTFFLPAHVSSGDNSSQASSRQQSVCTEEEGAPLQERFHGLYSRRMSAPELPPIAGDMERLRPGSHRSCYSQRSVGPNPRTLPPAPRSISRNDSDGSLRGLTTRSQGPTQSSGSVVSYGGGGVVGEGGRGDVAVSGGQERCLRSSSRALSWSTTDNSGAGSALRLETLFEQSHGLPRGASVTSLTVPDVQLSSQRSLDALPPRSVSVNDTLLPRTVSVNDTLPPRSVSVNSLRPSEARALARLRARKKLHSECGVLETVGSIEHFSRLRANGMRRAVSDNKLADKRNNPQLDKRNARVGVSSSSHLISVSRTDKLTHRKPSARPAGTASANMAATNGVRRATGGAPANNSVTAERQKTRLHSNRDSGHVEGESEDSEEEEERRERIREWLEGLDCADVPPEPVIDYDDDPPQTDTAVHIVYQQD